MNQKQKQVIGKILLLIAISGKGRVALPKSKQSDYQPWINLCDFQAVAAADIKNAQTVLLKTRDDILKIYQKAPSIKRFSSEDMKNFSNESQVLLAQYIGPWTKELPEWWYELYSLGLHLKIPASDYKAFILYPAKMLFNAIIKTLSQGGTLLSPVHLDRNRQMLLLNVCLHAAVPPQLLAELILLETDAHIQKQCIEMIIYFLREQATGFLSPLYQYREASFSEVSLWADAFAAASLRYSCYFQTDSTDIYAETNVSIQLGELASVLLAAMAMRDKAKTIEAFVAIKSYYESLPARLQAIKLYLGPMALYREFYMTLYTSAESGLKSDLRWYLAHLVPSYPTEHDVGFVIGGAALNYAYKQLDEENFHLIDQTVSSIAEYAQPLAYFGLLQQMLSRPQKLIAFASFYREQNKPHLLKSLFINLIGVAQIQETANAGWLGADLNQRGALPLKIVDGCLAEEYPVETTELTKRLLKEFAYFQHHQVAGILWVIWVRIHVGDKALLNASKQLGNAETEKWFSQRFIFQENPGQSGLVDEALAVNLFFSVELTTLIKQGNNKKVELLIKSLKPSLPKMSENVALYMITLCPNFSMAKTVLGELLESQTEEVLCIRILLHALYTNQPHILKTYAEMADKETVHKLLKNPHFGNDFSIFLYDTASQMLDVNGYKMPESFKVFSEMLAEEKTDFSLPAEQLAIFQHMVQLISMKGSLLEPIMARFFYLIKGKLNLLTKQEQKAFEQSTFRPTIKQLVHYLHLAHRLINLEEQDVSLCEKLAKGIYHTWVNVERSDRAQVRRFLLMLVDLINCIHSLVPKTVSPVIKTSAEDRMIRNNYLSLNALIKVLFYQMHARGFDEDASIIGRLHDPRLRRDFISAHIIRLILDQKMDGIKKMQQHFKTQIDYSVAINLFFELENNLRGGSDRERVLYFQSRRIFPLTVTVGDSLDFPFKQIDKVSITLEIISETGNFLGENIRNQMSIALRNQIDKCSEISALTQPTELFMINHLLMNELLLKANLDCIQLAFETFDCDQNLEIAKEIINTAIFRCSINMETEKRTALKIVKLLLNRIRDGWNYFASQSLIDNRNGNRISIIECIKHANIELFGLLYDYFVVESSKSTEAERPAALSELNVIPKHPNKEIDFEKIVETSYLKNKSAMTTISLARLKAIVEKVGLRFEGDIENFIRGYLAQADHAKGLDTMGVHAKPIDSTSQITRLFNASYFKGAWLVKNLNYFYPIRKSQTESYVYFNPTEIEDLKNPAPFQSLCEKLQFVGRSGAGLKYISNLRIDVDGNQIEGGFEMKIHGTKERILCYLAPSDHPDNPNVYVACRYLEDGLHGRVDPNKPFKIGHRPNAGTLAAEESRVANFYV